MKTTFKSKTLQSSNSQRVSRSRLISVTTKSLIVMKMQVINKLKMKGTFPNGRVKKNRSQSSNHLAVAVPITTRIEEGVVKLAVMGIKGEIIKGMAR